MNQGKEAHPSRGLRLQGYCTKGRDEDRMKESADNPRGFIPTT